MATTQDTYLKMANALNKVECKTLTEKTFKNQLQKQILDLIRDNGFIPEYIPSRGFKIKK